MPGHAMKQTKTKKTLERIRIQGYRSFKELEITLGPVNVLIGANGSGKSSFIQLFRMMNHMVKGDFQTYVAKAGGASYLMYYGPKVTDKIELEFRFKDKQHANGYSVSLAYASPDKLFIEAEKYYFHDVKSYPRPYYEEPDAKLFPRNESILPTYAREKGTVAKYVYEAMQTWRVYHFHDTSDSARVKQAGSIHDNEFLQPDAANLAAYLYYLREKEGEYYQRIIDVIRLVAPFFGDFVLRPDPLNPERIRLAWRERGSDLTFSAHALSDGMLRFICLATLFLQPPDKLPKTILLDEPELGLHPSAIQVLAEMVRIAAQHTQIILSTQSVTLVNHFRVEELLVVERVKDEDASPENPRWTTVIKRLDSGTLKDWLAEFSLGELWETNLLGGRP